MTDKIITAADMLPALRKLSKDMDRLFTQPGRTTTYEIAHLAAILNPVLLTYLTLLGTEAPHLGTGPVLGTGSTTGDGTGTGGPSCP